MKINKVLSLILAFAMILGTLTISVSAADGNVAKVGDTEYATIDEAIAAWTNGKTLTLLSDVTLSDVIKLKSTEMHTLDLATYTMTAASKKDAIEILNNGRTSASYALDIKADATNPGGITATGKACVLTKGKSGVKDRPIIRIYGGIYNASNVVKHSGSNGTNCPQFYFYDGEFNGSINTNRALLQFYGGTFHNPFFFSVDSSAYALISGGRFKSPLNNYRSALNSAKWTFGTSKGVFDVNIYIDDEGYYVVTKSEISEDDFEAYVPVDYASTSDTSTDATFKYSKLNVDKKLYYTSASVAASNNENIVLVGDEEISDTINVKNDLVMDCTSGTEYTGDVLLGKGVEFTVMFKEGYEFGGNVEACDADHFVVYEDTKDANGIVKREYKNDVAEAKIPQIEKGFGSLEAAVEAVNTLEEFENITEPVKVVVLKNVADATIPVKRDVEIVCHTSEIALTANENTTLTNVIFDVENGKIFALDGLNVEGLSYIKADRPESISVTNCDIDVTTENVKNNCPPAFLNFNGANDGSVVLTFANNSLKATSAEATHGIAGWNAIKSATITGNTFGSETAPLTAAAVKLMNFTDGAEVTVSENEFYVNSQDSTWGPNAIQFYQNNTRDNDFTVTVDNNEFFVDGETSAVGVNVNGMNDPETYKGGAAVNIASSNTVNGERIAMKDIIFFGNSINDIGYTRNYVGLDVETNTAGEITGGVFNKNSINLDKIAEGYKAEETTTYKVIPVDEKTSSIEVGFEATDDIREYDIVLKGVEGAINGFESAHFTFINNSDVDYKIAPNTEANITIVDDITNENRISFYMNADEKKPIEITSDYIKLGTVRFEGYGDVDFSIDSEDAKVNATTIVDSIVETFTTDANAVHKLIVNWTDADTTDKYLPNIKGDDLFVEQARKLYVDINFNNDITSQSADYTDMKVEVTGQNGEKHLGLIGEGTTSDATLEVCDYATVANNAASLEFDVTAGYRYTVKVSGAGYRTAEYTTVIPTVEDITADEGVTLTFWNNVKDEFNKTEIESGSDRWYTKNFLAGEIVQDNKINKYDLAAVVSYFGEDKLVENRPEYNKYDLNRDGVIDSEDIAYVLVSFGE